MHGELLKLGIRVAQSTVSIYMVPRRGRPLQSWKTFIHNHAEGIASIDLFVVPTIAYQDQLGQRCLGNHLCAPGKEERTFERHVSRCN
jgi:hypothetical protein